MRSAAEAALRDPELTRTSLGAAIAELARQEQSEFVAAAYGGGIEDLAFGPEYLIPKPFDPRLIVKIAPAVARAAMESGAATRPLADFDAYPFCSEQECV
jgi:malic enzyme